MAAAWKAPLAMSLAVVFSPSVLAIQLDSRNASKALRTTAQAMCGSSTLRDDYDAAAPFSEGAAGSFQSTQQLGTWEFLAASSVNSGTGTPLTFTSSSNSVRTGNTFIRSGQQLDLPAIGLGVDSTVISPSSSEGQIGAGNLGLHPGYHGDSEKYLLVRFTPAAGTTVSINGVITELGVDCGGLEASVSVGGTTLSSTTAIRSGAPWSFSNSAATSDPIEVYIGPGSVYYCDHSQISMSVSGCSSDTATPSPAGGAGAGASAVGDPHMRNIHGERFDLMKEGKHVLITIPRGMSAENALLHVQADARRLGGQCADMYFQVINVTGSWAEAKQAGGYHYSVSRVVGETPEWIVVGKVGLKIVHGHTTLGLQYLNLYVKHLSSTGFSVGGLLGEDDHGDAATPPASCHKRIALLAAGASGDAF